MPIDDAAQGIYSDLDSRTMAVIALGPQGRSTMHELEAARDEVPPDTTVVWLIAVDI